MGMTHSQESKIEADPGESLTPAEIADWVSTLPTEAKRQPVDPILGQTGHQRDPVTVLRGLRVGWTSTPRPTQGVAYRSGGMGPYEGQPGGGEIEPR